MERIWTLNPVLDEEVCATNVEEDATLPSFVENVAWKRACSNKCGTEGIPSPPAVRLASMPKTGTEWLMLLVEEATKIATQNPQSIPRARPGEPYLKTGETVKCRLECGAQSFWNETCTAGSAEAAGVRPAVGDEPEIFKTHYPQHGQQEQNYVALFETHPVIPKTIVLVRNPLDAYENNMMRMELAENDAKKI